MKKLNWQQEIDDQVKNERNDDLFEHMLNIAQGDDYDGSFTKRGEYEFEVTYIELSKRLTEIGFLLQF